MNMEIKTVRNSIILIFILFAAAALRLDGITWGLPSKTLSLTTYHPDEAYMFQVFEHMHKTHSLHPGKVGLQYGTFYFYLSGFLILLAKIVGFITVGSRDFLLQNLANLDRMYLVIRLFSALCGILSVLALYFLAKRLYNQSVGLWAAFFISFSPAAIAVSHYAKVDALVPLLIIILLWFSFNLMENPGYKNLVICGATTGLLASTKYNAGIFLFTPLISIYLSKVEKRLFLALFLISITFISFLATTPYAILDLPLFVACLKEQFGMLGGSGIWEVGYPNGYWRYLTFYFPFGMGWVTVILSFLGFFLLLISSENKEKLFLCSFLIFFLLIGRAAHRLTALVAPLFPFLSIFAAVTLSKSLTSKEEITETKVGEKTFEHGVVPSGTVPFLSKYKERDEETEHRIHSVSSSSAAAEGKRHCENVFLTHFWTPLVPFLYILIPLVLLYHISYGISFAALYSRSNTRESSGDWLLKNVPASNSVGIIRSYFWTPGLLRQKNPPYPLMKGSDEQTGFDLSILGLKSMVPLPSYFLVSELETREFFRTEKHNPVFAQALRDFFSSYQISETFELSPKIFGYSFWKRTPPWDFSMIAPTIRIYRNVAAERNSASKIQKI